jgi:hypothetical protein
MRKIFFLAMWALTLGSSAYGFQYWNDIRHTAMLPGNTVEIRIENPSGTGIENYLIYADNGIQETTMASILDGPSTLSASALGPVSETHYYGFRLIQGDELDFLPVRIGDGVQPEPSDLTRVATDATGDELFGYSNLDLTDCHISFSGDRLYATLQNVGGGFPVNQGLTFFGYLLAIADPALADPDTVWGLMYTYEQAGIIAPGLYRIAGPALGDLTKIGEVEVQEFPATNTLMISCLLSDLFADPYLSAWYDPSDPALGVAGFTQRISLLGGPAEADRSPGGRCYMREVSISPGVNQLPTLSNAGIQGDGAGAFAEIGYMDADGHCPVLAEIVFDGSLTFPLFPVTLDYNSTVTYRSSEGIGPLASDSWTTAVFRFSDNQTDVIEYEITATGVQDNLARDAVNKLKIWNTPNPFSASTAIGFNIPADTHVRVEIFDVNGAHIATVVDGYLEAGPQELRWSAGNRDKHNFGSGVYFARIQAGGAVQTRKMVLLR